MGWCAQGRGGGLRFTRLGCKHRGLGGFIQNCYIFDFKFFTNSKIAAFCAIIEFGAIVCTDCQQVARNEEQGRGDVDNENTVTRGYKLCSICSSRAAN